MRASPPPHRPQTSRRFALPTGSGGGILESTITVVSGRADEPVKSGPASDNLVINEKWEWIALMKATVVMKSSPVQMHTSLGGRGGRM